MNIVKAMRAPLALAIVGVAVASVLNDNPPARILGFWAGVSMMLGFAINSAVATYQRTKLMAHSVPTIRSAIAILSSFTWCLVGFSLATMGIDYLSYTLTSEYYHVMKDPPGFAGGVALVFAALSGICCGATSLLFVSNPGVHLYRASMLGVVMTLTATVLWSALSYAPFLNSDSQSHAVGAGVGTFLVVFLVPSMAIFVLALHFLLIRSIRTLVNLPIPSASKASRVGDSAA